jgi:uncharacterized protein YjbK
MNEKFEIEYKTLINNTLAYKLLSLGIFSFSGKQLNKYYDSNDEFFQKNRIVLRIREKAEQFLFTAKRETPEGLKETEFFVDSFNTNHEKISEFTNQFISSINLQEIGSTLTYRYTYKDTFGEWCLDFNVFSTISDIELEYELNQGLFDKEAHFMEQLKKWDIPYNPCESKFIRMKNK